MKSSPRASQGCPRARKDVPKAGRSHIRASSKRPSEGQEHLKRSLRDSKWSMDVCPKAKQQFFEKRAPVYTRARFSGVRLLLGGAWSAIGDGFWEGNSQCTVNLGHRRFRTVIRGDHKAEMGCQGGPRMGATDSNPRKVQRAGPGYARFLVLLLSS